MNDDTKQDRIPSDADLLDYAMAIAHERELRVTGHQHDEDGAVRRFEAAMSRYGSSQPAVSAEPSRCEDCPPVGYPTDKTRCTPCDRRTNHLVCGSSNGDGTYEAVPTASTEPASLLAVAEKMYLALCEELAAYDPPIHHVKVAVDAYLAWKHAAPVAQEPVPIPWQDVRRAILAVHAEARRRSEMYPQTSDEQADDRKAVHRVVDMLEWYATKGGAVAMKLADWPTYAAPVAVQAQPVVNQSLTTDPSAQDREDALTQAARDVLAERQRQVNAEGGTPEHDDEHAGESLVLAAASYAMWDHYKLPSGDTIIPYLWPWATSWWKPSNRRRNLVKAGALVIAEIERLDRVAARAAKEKS